MRLTLLSCLLIAGCATTSVPPAAPVVITPPAFPLAPADVSDCGDLGSVPDNAKLSDVAESVVDNYTLYHQCRAKVETWNQWYVEQRKNYNSAIAAGKNSQP